MVAEDWRSKTKVGQTNQDSGKGWNTPEEEKGYLLHDMIEWNH